MPRDEQPGAGAHGQFNRNNALGSAAGSTVTGSIKVESSPFPVLITLLDTGHMRSASSAAGPSSSSPASPESHASALSRSSSTVAILLTGGQAHDCPVAERLIRRVKPSKRMLGDKAYDSGELREELH